MSVETFHKKYDVLNENVAISKTNNIDFIRNTTNEIINFTSSRGESITAFPALQLQYRILNSVTQFKKKNLRKLMRLKKINIL